MSISGCLVGQWRLIRNILLRLVVWKRRGKDESPAKESVQVCLTFSITAAWVTESCPLGNENQIR